jgi:hypothetical protein
MNYCTYARYKNYNPWYGWFLILMNCTGHNWFLVGISTRPYFSGYYKDWLRHDVELKLFAVNGEIPPKFVFMPKSLKEVTNHEPFESQHDKRHLLFHKRKSIYN